MKIGIDFFKEDRKKIGILLPLLALLVVPYIFGDEPYLLHVFIIVFVYIALGQSWNLISGYAGQLCFATHIFFAYGAYTSLMLLLRTDLTPWIGLFVGMPISAGIAYLLGSRLFHLKGRYFAVATIAFAEIMKLVFLNWRFVGAAYGLSVPLKGPSLYYVIWTSKVPYFYIFLALAIISTLIVYVVDRSKAGMYFRSIKQDEDGAQHKGIDTSYFKLLAFMISAAMAAAVGTFYVQYVLYIDPRSLMDLLISAKIVMIVLFGSIGTVYGPVVGAAILIPLGEFMRIKLGGGGQGWDYVLYGLIILLIVYYRPQGVYIMIKNQIESMRRRTKNVLKMSRN